MRYQWGKGFTLTLIAEDDRDVLLLAEIADLRTVRLASSRYECSKQGGKTTEVTLKFSLEAK